MNEHRVFVSRTQYVCKAGHRVLVTIRTAPKPRGKELWAASFPVGESGKPTARERAAVNEQLNPLRQQGVAIIHLGEGNER